MIDLLLRRRLPSEYGLNADDVEVQSSVMSGIFTLSDSKSCRSCHENPLREDRTDCNEEVLKIDAGVNAVTVVAFEEYISQYEHSEADIKERCDYLMVDDTEGHRKIAFCDLTCSDVKWVEPNGGRYPEGKRAKAVSQMLKSMEVLLAEPLMCQYILTFADKVCLFGWRDYGSSPRIAIARRGDAMQNMQAFLSTPSSMARQMTSYQKIGKHDFKFVQIKYPREYIW